MTSSRLPRVLIVVTCALLVLAPATASYALWRAAATGTVAATTATLPTAPANFRCTSINTTTAATAWNAVGGSSSYRIYRRMGTAPDYTYAQVLSTTGTTANVSRATHLGGAASATLLVRSVNGAGIESLNSNLRLANYTAQTCNATT